VLELGLVLRDGEPRLRAYVRTDAGQLGWLTVELPGESLLESVNLYSKASIGKPTLPWRPRLGSGTRRPTVARVTLAGGLEGTDEAWAAGGKYRIVGRTALHEDADLGSNIIGSLKVGTLVLVHEVCRVSTSPGQDGPVRLRVSAEGSSSNGWISSTSSSGEVQIDVRDHLEYEKLLRSTISDMERQEVQPSVPAKAAPQVHEFNIQLQRCGDVALGIHVDHSDGLTLAVKAVTAGGLFEAWNCVHPDRDVHAGDRLLSVNGCSGDAIVLLEKLSQDPTLDLTFQTERLRAPPPRLQPQTQQRPRPQALELETEDERTAETEVLGAREVPQPEPEDDGAAETAGGAERKAVITPEFLASGLNTADGVQPGETAARRSVASLPACVATAGACIPASAVAAGALRACVPAAGPTPGPMRLLGGTPTVHACAPATGAQSAGALPACALPAPRAGERPAGRPSDAGGVGLRSCAAAALPAPIPPLELRSAVRLFVTEEGPDWETVDAGAAEPEEPLSTCPCRADRAWILNGIGGLSALFGCGGDTGKRRLLMTHENGSSNPGRGGRFA